MSQMHTVDKRTLTRLLGDYAAEGGPFALLGLTPAPTTKGQVEAALQRQLDRLAQHPETDTLAADQVRVLLHESATELLNTRRQTELIELAHRGRTGGRSEPEPQPVRGASSGRHSRAKAERVGDPMVAKAILAAGGLIMVMIVALVVISMFTSSPSGSGSGKTAGPSAGAGATPTSGAPNDSPAAPAAAAAPSAEAPDTAKPTADKAVRDNRAIDPSKPRARGEFVDPVLIIRELRGAGETAKADPDKAMVEFERAFRVAGDWWCRFETAQVRAAGDAVVEFMYRVGSRRERADRVLAIIDGPTRVLHASGRAAVGVDDVWPAAWSAGTLARFYRERDLPPGVSTEVAAAIDRALRDARPARSADSTFETGAAAALRQLPRTILAGPATGLGANAEQAEHETSAALARWIEGVTLWSHGDATERERYLTGALAWILTSAPEPESDSRIFAAITTLAGEIKWRAGGPARPALVEWFRDPRVSIGDLRVLTAALSSKSGAEGVDSTMALPMSARSDERAAMRDRYAKAWGLAEASARADAAKAWILSARAAVETPIDAKSPTAQIEYAAAYAKLSTAAATIWRGGAPESAVSWDPPVSAGDDDLVNIPGTNVFRFRYSLPNSGVTAATGNGQDGIWALDYLSEKHSIPGRLKRLEELVQRGRPIGPIDAGLLAQAAISESPWKVREQAQATLRGFAEEPALINAMLDFLPLAPHTTDVSRLYGDVSGGGQLRAADPNWEVEARRAILSRLMSMLTASGAHGDIETSTAEIARSYLASVGRKLSGNSADEVADGAASGVLDLAEQFSQEAKASPVSGATKFNLDAIERRRQQRRLQATGPVQNFAAEQSGLLELLGFLAATDRPISETAIAAVLDRSAAERRKASHVFEQVLINERAMVRLWLIRFGEEVRP